MKIEIGFCKRMSRCMGQKISTCDSLDAANHM